LIANAFFRTGLIEAWGRGIEKILDECKQHGVHTPVFDYEPSGLMLLFKGIMPDSQDRTTLETIMKMSGKTRGETRGKILKLISEDSAISIKEMSDRIGITQKGIEWQIMRLKKDGVLQRIGPAKGGYWKVIEE